MQQQRRLLEGRLKQIKSFEERLAKDAKRLREEAKLFAPDWNIGLWDDT
jgi:hypothetical protein